MGLFNLDFVTILACVQGTQVQDHCQLLTMLPKNNPILLAQLSAISTSNCMHSTLVAFQTFLIGHTLKNSNIVGSMVLFVT